MITEQQARTRIGDRVLFVHPLQRGRRDGFGVLRGLDPTDPKRALVKFDYDSVEDHVSHPVRELLVFVNEVQGDSPP